MRNYFLLLVLVAFSCNSNQRLEEEREKASLDNNCFVYPKAIDSLQMRDLYDNARWYVYTWHCDDVYLSKRDTSIPITFGELPLKFSDLTFKGDTLEINFDFFDEDENYSIIPSMTRDNRQFLSGVGFDMKAGKRIYMRSPNGFTQVEKGPASRYENPMQPEVLAYIKNNWNKLDNCFKELARQKGINQ